MKATTCPNKQNRKDQNNFNSSSCWQHDDTTITFKYLNFNTSEIDNIKRLQKKGFRSEGDHHHTSESYHTAPHIPAAEKHYFHNLPEWQEHRHDPTVEA